MRLWGEVLGSVSINSLGIAVARVSKATLAKTGATESDLAGLAKYLCSIEGTKATLVLVETDDGWRGSLRTRSRTFNVGRLAKLLGGNGGRKVAGFLATDELVSGTLVDESRKTSPKSVEIK
jgi:nanoRNase/pAp phosphatase (c-di-AMP/oligoRNAs hydrolase)